MTTTIPTEPNRPRKASTGRTAGRLTTAREKGEAR